MQKIRYLDKLVDELAKGKADGEDPARVTIMPAPKSRVRTTPAGAASGVGAVEAVMFG